MVKNSKWITGLAMILVAVLAVGVFCAPEAAAAEINYGSANLAAIADANEKKAVDIAIKAQGYMTDTTPAICPICRARAEAAGENPTATSWTPVEAGKYYDAQSSILHLKVADNVTAGAWPLDMDTGSNRTVHVYLEKGKTWTFPEGNGTIFFKKDNNELVVMGSGAIHSKGSGSYGIFSLNGTGHTVSLLGGTFTNAHATVPAIQSGTSSDSRPTNVTVNIYDGVTIGRAQQADSTSSNVELYGVTLNMYGGTIQNGRRTSHGGNIYLGSTGKFNMYGGTVTGGVAGSGAYGGNIYSDGAVVNLYGGTITGGDNAVFGGNIASLGGSITIAGTALVANGNAVCVTDEAGAVTSSANGGNIYINGGCQLNISGGKIADGILTGGPASETTGIYTDSGAGGNIMSYNGIIKMSGGMISGGVAANGASVYMGGNTSEFALSGGTISGGRAKWGGSVYAANGKITISGGTISGGTAAFRGGNVFLEGAATANITGGTIADGEVDWSASSLDRTGGNIHRGTGSGKLTVSGGTISGGVAARGGNIGVADSTVEIIGAAKVKEGLGIYQGGNIWVGNNGKEGESKTVGTLIVSGGRISDGRSANGGNICAVDGNATITGGTITGGQAYYDNKPQFDIYGELVVLGSQYRGGNIFTTIDMSITGGTISNGESLVSWGGNIYAQKCELTVSGGVITGGKALGTSDGRGGNIAGKNAVINISKKATVLDGKALEGGNIFIEEQESQLNVSGGKISGGKAVSGGNVYLAQNMIMVLSDGEVTDGTAEQGGNVYVGYNAFLLQTAGTITGGACKQASANDGDIDFDDLVVEIPKKASATANKYQGADVYLYNGDYVLMGGTVTADTGSTTSSIYTDAGRVYLAGNSTVNAGSIYITETGKIHVDNSWSGDASVLFPKTYASAEKVDVALAVNGDLLVAEDFTIIFTPGGAYTEGKLRQGVGSDESFVAVGKDGVIILGKADCAAMIGGTTYTTLEQALDEAMNGDTIVMYAPATLDYLYLKKGRTLDLNGYDLIITDGVTAANKTAHIIDSSNGEGVLDVKKGNCALNTNNKYLPVWIKNEGFHFVLHTFTAYAPTDAQMESLGATEVAIRFNISGTVDCLLARALADGGLDNDVKVKIKLYWTNSAGLDCSQSFVFSDQLVKAYAQNGGADNNWTTHKFRVTVNNTSGATNLRFAAVLSYNDVTQIESQPYSGYTK